MGPAAALAAVHAELFGGRARGGKEQGDAGGAPELVGAWARRARERGAGGAVAAGGGGAAAEGELALRAWEWLLVIT